MLLELKAWLECTAPVSCWARVEQIPGWVSVTLLVRSCAWRGEPVCAVLWLVALGVGDDAAGAGLAVLCVGVWIGLLPVESGGLFRADDLRKTRRVTTSPFLVRACSSRTRCRCTSGGLLAIWLSLSSRCMLMAWRSRHPLLLPEPCLISSTSSSPGSASDVCVCRGSLGPTGWRYSNSRSVIHARVPGSGTEIEADYEM